MFESQYIWCHTFYSLSFSADFIMMFLFGGVLMTIIACFVNLVFLGQAFTIMLVYIWAKRNPYIRMNFFGMLNFNAPYLPWVRRYFSNSNLLEHGRPNSWGGVGTFLCHVKVINQWEARYGHQIQETPSRDTIGPPQQFWRPLPRKLL